MNHYHHGLMPNFTLSEILTIALVILIVFGPQRLPEIARKTGQAVRKARQMAGDLRREFEGEFREVAEPLREVRDELKGVGQEVGSSLDSLSDEVAQAKKEVDAQLAEAGGEAQETVAPPAEQAADESGSTSGDAPDEKPADGGAS